MTDIFTYLYATDGVAVIKDLLDRPSVNVLTSLWETHREALCSARSDRFVTIQLPALLSTLPFHPSLVDLAQDLLHTTNLALYMNRLLVKDRTWSGAVALHQDQPYFHGSTSKLSLFIPLAPISCALNGGLIFVKGSHYYGPMQRGTILRDKFPVMEDLAPDLDVGDVVAMDWLTWHYSRRAGDPQDRPLLQIVYQSSEDGSFGVSEPTLVSGEWRTEHFSPMGAIEEDK